MYMHKYVLEYSYYRYSTPLIVKHFVDLDGLELSQCRTIGCVWDILT